MMFSKVFFFILFLFFFVFLLFFNLSSFSSLSSFFYFSLDEKILFSVFGLSLDYISLLFIMMVSVVTCLVFLYSEVYMELYNNKKFFFLTLLFFFFMSFLSLSSGVMNIMIGWDGLGISSLLLIMFYPNKITFFNSLLTFFFNRLGDLMFMIFFCFFLMDYSSFFFFSKVSNFYVIFIFFLCLLTKSAQFPFSSWLPAAMSAPTPISAMVHSSTLVTAGILLFFKFYNFFSVSSMFFFLMIFSLITFILGGFLGSIELDLKKIVAFSTMSQISMILFFMVTSVSLAFFHTFGHALFKTLLFCSCGILFLWNFSDQLSKNLTSKNFYLSVFFFFLVSIYAMSGLIFSSSFYTKDLILEFFLEEKYFLFFLFLMIGSVMTVFYSSKIFCSMMFKPSFKTTFSFKISHFSFIFIFSMLTIFFLKFLMSLSFFNMSCFLSSSEVLFINIIILLFFFAKFNASMFYYLSMEILFMKNFFFSLNSKVLLNMPNSFSSSDNFFFKPSMMSLKNFNFDSSVIKFWVYMFILFLSFFLFF